MEINNSDRQEYQNETENRESIEDIMERLNLLESKFKKNPGNEIVGEQMAYEYPETDYSPGDGNF